MLESYIFLFIPVPPPLGDWNKHMILQGVKPIIFQLYFHAHDLYYDSFNIWVIRIAQNIQWHWLAWESKTAQAALNRSNCSFVACLSFIDVKSQKVWVWCWCAPAKGRVFGFMPSLSGTNDGGATYKTQTAP